jgi:hypothetical protein
MGSVTNFPYGVSSFGIPLPSGGLPPMIDGGEAARQVYYFVDGLRGRTGGEATQQDPVDTIAAAITKANAAINWSASPWGPRKVIVIAPGKYAENLTSLPYGSSLVGLGNFFDLNGENGVTIKPDSGSPVDVTSCINMLIQNIAFESPDTSVVFQADNFNRNTVRNCLFSGLPGSSPTTVKGLETVKDMTGNLIEGCIFQVCRNGIYIVVDNTTSKQASGNIINNCIVRGADQKGIYIYANSVPSYTMVNNSHFGDGSTTLALGCDDDSDAVAFNFCTFRATANDPASGAGKYNGCYLNGALIT